MTIDQDRLRQIDTLRSTLHRQMGGQYDPVRLAQLVPISQELDRLVVEVTRRQWSGPSSALPQSVGKREERPTGRGKGPKR